MVMISACVSAAAGAAKSVAHEAASSAERCECLNMVFPPAADYSANEAHALRRPLPRRCNFFTVPQLQASPYNRCEGREKMQAGLQGSRKMLLAAYLVV